MLETNLASMWLRKARKTNLVKNGKKKSWTRASSKQVWEDFSAWDAVHWIPTTVPLASFNTKHNSHFKLFQCVSQHSTQDLIFRIQDLHSFSFYLIRDISGPYQIKDPHFSIPFSTFSITTPTSFKSHDLTVSNIINNNSVCLPFKFNSISRDLFVCLFSTE
jgi:hypothetical protein